MAPWGMQRLADPRVRGRPVATGSRSRSRLRWSCSRLPLRQLTNRRCAPSGPPSRAELAIPLRRGCCGMIGHTRPAPRGLEARGARFHHLACRQHRSLIERPGNYTSKSGARAGRGRNLLPILLRRMTPSFTLISHPVSTAGLRLAPANSVCLSNTLSRNTAARPSS